MGACTKQSNTNSPKNHVTEAKKQSNKKQSGLRSRWAPKFVLSPTLCCQARNTLTRLRWSLFCLIYLLNKEPFSAYRLVKTIITWDCFSDCFVLDCFPFIFILFRTVLYGNVCADTSMSLKH